MRTAEWLPCWEQDGCAPEPVDDRPVPEVPAWMAQDDAEDRDHWLTPEQYAPLLEAGGGSVLNLPYRSRRDLVEAFAARWAAVQTATAQLWQAAAAVAADGGSPGPEFVGDDLALVMNVHPMTGRGLLATAMGACAVPALVDLVERAELSDKHAAALLVEAGRWCDDLDGQAELIRLTLERCQARVDAGHGWPTPGQLKKRLATVAFLQGLAAAEKRKKSVADRRGVALFPTGIEAACLSIEGPQVMVAQMMDAIRARAQALRALPGNTRTLEQCEFDAAHDLLCVDADGGESCVPALDVDGRPVTIRVRGIEISLLVPYSTATGSDLELAELPGLGPVLPSTARELLAQAEQIRRIAVDADTGHVIAVDDTVPGPAAQTRRRAPDPEPTEAMLETEPQTEPEPDTAAEEPKGNTSDEVATDAVDAAPADAPPMAHEGEVERGAAQGSQGTQPAAEPDAEPASEPAAEPQVPAEVLALLRRLAAEPVVTRDLSSSRYRVPKRLRLHVAHRDLTCTFPGCTVPGRYCDLDHREPWPHGPTSETNCHCLCRRHHRAKQGYFTVTVDPKTGDTIWTTPDGRQYRRPPPTY